MRYFGNPTSTVEVHMAMSSRVISCITTPLQGNKIPDNSLYCADNGCFGSGYPGDEKWFSWLSRQTNKALCEFATAPDVVGNAKETIARSKPWMPKIREIGLPVAFVGQDGLDAASTPWDEFDTFFIGGSTEWKLGSEVRDLVAAAKNRGKSVHMGRVNSAKRLQYANDIGCDSADGTYISFGPHKNLPNVLYWLDTIHPAVCITCGDTVRHQAMQRHINAGHVSVM